MLQTRITVQERERWGEGDQPASGRIGKYNVAHGKSNMEGERMRRKQQLQEDEDTKIIGR